MVPGHAGVEGERIVEDAAHEPNETNETTVLAMRNAKRMIYKRMLSKNDEPSAVRGKRRYRVEIQCAVRKEEGQKGRKRCRRKLNLLST